MSDSQPPLSSPQEIPGTSGGAALYLAGIVVMGGLTAGMLYWRLREPTPNPLTAVSASAPASAPAATRPVPLHALPPPPKIEEMAEPTAKEGGQEGAATASATGRPAAAGPCGACGDGLSSGALTAALQTTASAAAGCYKRALRSSEVSGSITVSVKVGSTGSVCGASITKDTIGSGEIASCVLGKFQGRSFPAPRSGCVVVNIPIKFEIKQ